MLSAWRLQIVPSLPLSTKLPFPHTSSNELHILNHQLGGAAPRSGTWLLGLPQSALGRAPDGQVFSSPFPCQLPRSPTLLCMLSSHIGLHSEHSGQARGSWALLGLSTRSRGVSDPLYMCLRSWVGSSPWVPHLPPLTIICSPRTVYVGFFLTAFLAILTVGHCLSFCGGCSPHHIHIPVAQSEAGVCS